MTHSDFRARASRLGCHNPHALAHRLGYAPGYMHRVWHGQCPVSSAVRERLEDVERAQPVAGLTPDMGRVLLASPARAGSQVRLPPPRSNFERSLAWHNVLSAMDEAGLVEGVTELRLTALGARTRAWLVEREAA